MISYEDLPIFKINIIKLHACNKILLRSVTRTRLGPILNARVGGKISSSSTGRLFFQKNKKRPKPKCCRGRLFGAAALDKQLFDLDLQLFNLIGQLRLVVGCYRARYY